MKLSIITILMGLVGGMNSNAEELSQRTYTFKTYASTFVCYEGTPANGHNFPTSTTIAFRTGYGSSGIYYPSKIPLNNTNKVIFEDRAANPCSKYADLLNREGLLDGQATQDFSTEIKRTGTGECFKRIREVLTITVAGYRFSGVDVTYLPVQDSDCQ